VTTQLAQLGERSPLIRESERFGDSSFYKSVLDAIYDGVYFVDSERRITYWNQSAERLTGYAAEEVVGRYCYDNMLMHMDCSGKQLCTEGCPLQGVLQDGAAREAEVYLRHREGHRVPVAVRVAALMRDERVRGAVEIFSDNTNSQYLRRKTDQLQNEALTDALTELPNRRCLEEALARALSSDRRFGVLLCDLDRFKRVNDRYGHEVGDAVLKTTAKSLRHALRTNDLVGRWGGEEFLAVLDLGEQESMLFEIAERCRIMVAGSSAGGNAAVRTTISIGATVAMPGEDRASLVERADRLLYRSKRAGRNRVSIATEAL
jgi:diguanylate cyclase (GGDEF)-like protein/PAS domain S-box-containing protein